MTREVNTDYVAPASFARFVLRCSDKAASVDWYGKVLGMEVVHENPMIAFMTYDDEHHRIALVQVNFEGEVPKGAPGLGQEEVSDKSGADSREEGVRERVPTDSEHEHEHRAPYAFSDHPDPHSEARGLRER